jgi:hypothetical protein
MKKKGNDKKGTRKDETLKLDMSFEQAMKKALNTPLPKNPKKKK